MEKLAFPPLVWARLECMKPLLFSCPAACLLRCLVLAGLAGTGTADAAITGRYVRLAAPASERMAPHEIEVFAGPRNLGRAAAGLKFAGTGYKGRDINFREDARQLIDGRHDPAARGLAMGVEDVHLFSALKLPPPPHRVRPTIQPKLTSAILDELETAGGNSLILPAPVTPARKIARLQHHRPRPQTTLLAVDRRRPEAVSHGALQCWGAAVG